MASPKNAPRGQFDYILAVDCETTGVCFSNDNPVYNEKTGERHQTVSWGVIVTRADTLKPIETLYIEIKWNEESKAQKKKDSTFGSGATAIHGLSQKHLEQHGITEEEAVVSIGSLIMKYWGPANNIVTLGHNVHTFDMPFLRDLFVRHGVDIRFASRHIDTNSIGFVNWNTFNSDDLFKMVGFEDRENHNALQDIQQTLEAARITRLIFNKALTL